MTRWLDLQHTQGKVVATMSATTLIGWLLYLTLAHGIQVDDSNRQLKDSLITSLMTKQDKNADRYIAIAEKQAGAAVVQARADRDNARAMADIAVVMETRAEGEEARAEADKAMIECQKEMCETQIYVMEILERMKITTTNEQP